MFYNGKSKITLIYFVNFETTLYALLKTFFAVHVRVCPTVCHSAIQSFIQRMRKWRGFSRMLACQNQCRFFICQRQVCIQ